MEGFECLSATQKVWKPPVFELVAAIIHWMIAFRWVQIPSIAKQKDHPRVVFLLGGDGGI